VSIAAKARREARIKRQTRVRKKVLGVTDCPRLCVFRSSKHIYVQLIDDGTGRTLGTASTLDKDVAEALDGKTGNIAAAKAVGASVARKALAQNIERVVFDRNGFLYHGRVQALADAAREAGLAF